MEPKYRKFYVEWWSIKKSSVYAVVGLLVFLPLIGLGSWWFIKSSRLFNDPSVIVIPKDAAKLTSFEGDVRIIRASTRQTDKVAQKTFVTAGDTIQTGSDGKAQVEMIDGSVISVRPNSTVVIRDSSSIFGGANIRVSLGDGQINVKTEEQTEETRNIIEVKESENRVFSQTEASFNINQKTQGGEIRISRGGIESSVGSEKTVLSENEYAAVNNGRITSREKLLKSPALLAPASLEQILSEAGGATLVNFRWQKPEISVGSYNLQISNSPFFVADSIVKERDGIMETAQPINDIMPGNYYWRIRALTSAGQLSDWSEPWRFTIIKREGSNTIVAGEWKVDNLGGGLYRISGKTLPGATVRAAGKETFAVGNGEFLLQVKAPSNEVAVEISDEKGNRSRYNLSLATGTATSR